MSPTTPLNEQERNAMQTTNAAPAVSHTGRTLGFLALALLLLGIGILGMGGLPSLLPLNDRAPAYLKDVVAYKEGDGLVLYMILADETGAMTTATGHLHVTITNGQTPVHSLGMTVSKEQFQRTTVGRGAFAHEVILYMIGRLPYHTFSQSVTDGFGTVEMRFTPTAGLHKLTGKTSVVF